MIDALIAGRITGKPAERTTKAGKPFCTAKLRVATGNGDTAFVSVVAFSEHVVTALLALADGDSAAISGQLAASAFTDKDGTPRPSLDLIAHQLLTSFHVGRKRKAMQPETVPQSPPDQELSDDRPF